MDKTLLVAVTGFASVWRYRLGRPMHEPGRFAQPVYYNTTGVVVNGNLRQRAKICGYARFDAIGGFDPNHLQRMNNQIFECAEPCVWMGFNKLLFKRVIRPRRPDCYLVIARFGNTGRLHVGEENWRSPDSWLLSFSEGAGQQETMLLLPPCGWIQTDLGKFVLETREQCPWEGRLALCAEH